MLIAPTAVLAAPGTPVSRGAYVSIFCTGLGAVTNQPATGVRRIKSAFGYPDIAHRDDRRRRGRRKLLGTGTQFRGGSTRSTPWCRSAYLPATPYPVVISVGTIASNTVTIAVQ